MGVPPIPKCSSRPAQINLLQSASAFCCCTELVTHVSAGIVRHLGAAPLQKLVLPLFIHHGCGQLLRCPGDQIRRVIILPLFAQVAALIIVVGHCLIQQLIVLAGQAVQAVVGVRYCFATFFDAGDISVTVVSVLCAAAAVYYRTRESDDVFTGIRILVRYMENLASVIFPVLCLYAAPCIVRRLPCNLAERGLCLTAVLVIRVTDGMDGSVCLPDVLPSGHRPVCCADYPLLCSSCLWLMGVPPIPECSRGTPRINSHRASHAFC